MTTHPEVLWAQRSSADEEEKNIIYLTINLTEINESTLKIDIQPTEITFEAKAGRPEEKEFKFHLTLFGEIDPEKSSKKLTTRSLVLVLRKKEKKLEFWPRLTKDKLLFVKTDFDKWVDEDEQDEDSKIDEEGFDGMGGMGGMGGGLPGMGDFGNMMGGGMPGMGDGMGGMDFEKMMADMQKNKAGSGPDGMDPADSDDSADDEPPALEDAEETNEPASSS